MSLEATPTKILEGTGYRHSDPFIELASAFALAQMELTNPEKSEAAEIGGKQYRYSDLASVLNACRPIFAKHGIGIWQLPSTAESLVSITTLLIHKTGQFLESTITYWYDPSVVTPQGLGMIITYLRRYALLSISGLAGEDDDAAAVTKAIQGAQVSQKQTPVKSTKPVPGLVIDMKDLPPSAVAQEAFLKNQTRKPEPQPQQKSQQSKPPDPDAEEAGRLIAQSVSQVPGLSTRALGEFCSTLLGYPWGQIEHGHVVETLKPILEQLPQDQDGRNLLIANPQAYAESLLPPKKGLH